MSHEESLRKVGLFILLKSGLQLLESVTKVVDINSPLQWQMIIKRQYSQAASWEAPVGHQEKEFA